MAKKANTRNKSPEEQVRIKNAISRYYFEGVSAYKMKDLLKQDAIDLSVRSIYVYIRKMKDEWLEMRNSAIETILLEELAKLDNMEKTVWEAWNRSCQQSESKTAEKRLSPKQEKTSDGATTTKAQITEQVITEKQELRDGNPKFIELLLNIHEKRMALLGKEKAVQVFVQNNYQNAETNNYHTAINNGNYIIEVSE